MPFEKWELYLGHKCFPCVLCLWYWLSVLSGLTWGLLRRFGGVDPQFAYILVFGPLPIGMCILLCNPGEPLFGDNGDNLDPCAFFVSYGIGGFLLFGGAASLICVGWEGEIIPSF